MEHVNSQIYVHYFLIMTHQLFHSVVCKQPMGYEIFATNYSLANDCMTQFVCNKLSETFFYYDKPLEINMTTLLSLAKYD